jgi:hypothetical protein
LTSGSFIGGMFFAFSIILFNLKDILGGVVLLSTVWILTDILSHFPIDLNNSISSICFICKIQRAVLPLLMLANNRFLSTELTIQS